MTQFLGRAEITLNGEVYDSAPGATLNLGGIKNNAKVYGNKVGRVEELEPATLTMEIPLAVGQSLATVRGLKDATVIFKADTGQSFIIRNAFRTDNISLKDGDGGNVAIAIAGDPAEELTS